MKPPVCLSILSLILAFLSNDLASPKVNTEEDETRSPPLAGETRLRDGCPPHLDGSRNVDIHNNASRYGRSTVST